MARFLVSDSVTYERSWVVEAENEDAAIDKACNLGVDEATYQQEQVEAQPYDARLITPEEEAQRG